MIIPVAQLAPPTTGDQTADLHSHDGVFLWVGYYVFTGDGSLWIWVNQSIADMVYEWFDVLPTSPALLCNRSGFLFDIESLILAGIAPR